jgi:hypothetical protein
MLLTRHLTASKSCPKTFLAWSSGSIRLLATWLNRLPFGKYSKMRNASLGVSKTSLNSMIFGCRADLTIWISRSMAISTFESDLLSLRKILTAYMSRVELSAHRNLSKYARASSLLRSAYRSRNPWGSALQPGRAYSNRISGCRAMTSPSKSRLCF